MTSAREITALRKAGQLDEAYQKALELIAAPDSDRWAQSAYAWCLIALLKRHAADGNQARLAEYLERLEAFTPPADDELLTAHRQKALALSRGDRRAVLAARMFGKSGQHEQAIQIYADLLGRGELQVEDKVSYGWELYFANREIMKSAGREELSPTAVNAIRRHLFTYLKLGCPAPDRLHSLVLKQALRLASKDQLRLVDFLRLWNPENVRSEDFERNVADDGKVYPALVENVAQRVCREAAKGERKNEMQFVLPFAKRAMERYPDNVWLQHGVVKLLRGLERMDEAWALATDFARKKAKEYWTWELLGELASDRSIRSSCYAKALTCSQDDTFVGKVRLKFAELLFNDFPGQARYELDRVLAPQAGSGKEVREKAQRLLASSSLAVTAPVPTDRAFYLRFTAQAEELLFAHLPWTEASLGGQFVIAGKDGQKKRTRRQVFIKDSRLALEISVPDSLPEIRGKAPGTPLWIQAESSASQPGRMVVHRIRLRQDGALYDVAPEMVGVIDHVNREKALLHFVVAREIHGTWPLSDFRASARPGLAVVVRLARRNGRQGERTSVLSISATNKVPGQDVCRAFTENVKVTDNGLGFTDSDVFIPPNLVKSAGISDGDVVEVIAILNHDKKQDTWGMKAISVRVV